MLVGFNPYLSNTNNPKKVNFKSLKDGKIVAEEVAKYTSNAEECIDFISLGTYKPTVENLTALLKAKEIAARDEYAAVAFKVILDEAIEMLKKKAKQVGINLGN